MLVARWMWWGVTVSMDAHSHRLKHGYLHAWRNLASLYVKTVCIIQLSARAASQFSIHVAGKAQAEATAKPSGNWFPSSQRQCSTMQRWQTWLGHIKNAELCIEVSPITGAAAHQWISEQLDNGACPVTRLEVHTARHAQVQAHLLTTQHSIACSFQAWHTRTVTACVSNIDTRFSAFARMNCHVHMRLP